MNRVHIFKHELVKLLLSPAVLGFLGICLVLNTVMVFTTSHRRREINYLNTLTEITGTVYGEEYSDRLQSVPEPDRNFYPDSWLYREAIQAAEDARNVFAGLNGEITEALRESEAVYSKLTLKIQRWKYGLLAPVIDAKAASEDGSSVYFGPQSDTVHEAVFCEFGRLLAAECCIFFVLIMLWALGYEGMTKTSSVVFASKTGRRLAVHKILAALTAGTAFFAVIYALSYGLTFAVNDFSQVWGQNVSAQYHTSYDVFFGPLPFITWKSMAVGSYFFATAGTALLNGIVLALLAVPFGLLVKNVYTAFCSLAGLCFLHLLYYRFGIQMAKEQIPLAWNLSLIWPLTQIFNNTLWFTDGGMQMLLPHFELLYPLVCILLLCPAFALCARRFSRKDI